MSDIFEYLIENLFQWTVLWLFVKMLDRRIGEKFLKWGNYGIRRIWILEIFKK